MESTFRKEAFVSAVLVGAMFVGPALAYTVFVLLYGIGVVGSDELTRLWLQQLAMGSFIGMAAALCCVVSWERPLRCAWLTGGLATIAWAGYYLFLAVRAHAPASHYRGFWIAAGAVALIGSSTGYFTARIAPLLASVLTSAMARYR